MGRHRPTAKGGTSVHDLLAEIAARDAAPTTVPIVMDDTGRFHPPPSIRWAAAGVGVLAAGSLLSADVPPTVEIAAVAPASQATILASEPVTGESIRADLAALQANRAEREAAEEQAQAVQAEADRVETERLAEEARQREAEEAELARQQAAQEEATRESQRAAQEATERAAEATTGRHRAEAAQEAQQTVESAPDPEPAQVSADGPGAIVPGGRVTSGFGSRWGTTHYGVDVAGPLGSPIYSPVAGTVLRAGPASGFGNAIYIEDSDGDVWLFGHMKTMYVTQGGHVNIGDKIALVGNQGQSTGPHVHIERHLGVMNGTKVDPAPRLGL